MMNKTGKKGFSMALPFIAGVAAGVLAVVAWNKKDELKDKTCKSLQKGKEIAMDSLQKGKDELKKVIKKDDKEKQVAKKVTKKPKAKKAQDAKDE